MINKISKIPKPSLPHPKLSSISNWAKQPLWAGTSVKCEFSSSEVPLGFSLQRILKGQHWTRGQLVDKEFSNYIQHLNTFKHFQTHRGPCIESWDLNVNSYFFINNQHQYVAISSTFIINKGSAAKSDESEKNPNGFRPPRPHFRNIILQLFMTDMVAYMRGGMRAR